VATSDSLTVGTSAAVIYSGDADGSVVSVRNLGTGVVYVGGSDVTIANGFPLDSGVSASVDLAAGEKLYAVSDADQSVRIFASARL
jgi:hypothetical protein